LFVVDKIIRDDNNKNDGKANDKANKANHLSYNTPAAICM